MKKLAGLRVRAGLTQTDVAKVIGVTQGAISAWERGEKKPTLDKLPTLAKLYGVSEQTILRVCTEIPSKGAFHTTAKDSFRKAVN